VFGKGKLLRDGAPIDGMVVSSVANDTYNNGIADAYRVTVRVRFDDGSSAEITRKLHRREVGWQPEGAIVPLRYDPSDRSKIELDEPALVARHADRASAAHDTAAARIAQAELRIEHGFPTAAAAPTQSGDPRRDILELSIRRAQQRGDAAEVARLTSQLERMQG
jgi:hypothetical protein